MMTNQSRSPQSPRNHAPKCAPLHARIQRATLPEIGAIVRAFGGKRKVKDMLTPPQRQRGTNLRERILAAETVTEIEGLLREGATFAAASDRTVAQWKRAAALRRKELEVNS